MMDFKKLQKTIVIAEAGSNWKVGSYQEDLKQAKKLIDAALKAGADVVKFQTFQTDTIVVPNAGKIEYLKKKGIDKTINEIFDELSMSYEMIPELANYCKSKEIEFMSTPFSIADAKAIDPYVKIHKIASFEINHIRLLEFLAKTKKPILISTGASSYDEIDFAINLLKDNGNDQICILQCTSKYPAPIESLNLNTISTMRKKYDLPTGLSDHSIESILAPICAIGLGAIVIEKHFTLDRNLPGPDHKHALIPEELESMVKSIRLAEQAKGNGNKTILDVEQELHEVGTRAIQAIQKISKDEILQEGVNFDLLRPGMRKRGLEPRFLSKVQGKKSSKNVDAGDGILEIE